MLLLIAILFTYFSLDYLKNSIILLFFIINLTIFAYTINNREYNIPNIGIRCKIWDFDFASIPGIINNQKVNVRWTRNINITPERHQYYDVHYFFNTLVSRGFVPDILGYSSSGKPNIPIEVSNFIKRVIPSQMRSGQFVTERGRLLLKSDELYKVEGLIYRTPEDILIHDPFFAKMREN